MEDLFNDEIVLTDKEEKVLKMLAAGKKSAEIADELHLSLPAIKWYRQRLRSKFDAATTGELLMKAVARRIL
ncbi:MAG: helix-turn-helix transcriptional regulator [Bacteroidales bacterium]|nr:helix-turn-helix transcriptional regulator [Bacteroidales bacterium]